MSLVSELEDLIARTGTYSDRDLLERILYQLKKEAKNHWGSEENFNRNRR